MTTYNTGNPLGSSDPRDLYDNAENLDNLVNGDQPSYDDRLGESRKSWAGMEQDFADFLASSGYELLGDYASGIEVTAYNQVIRDGGEFWRAAADTELPYTTTGSGMPEGGAFVSVGDAVLRQELAADTGAGLVGTSSGDTVQEAINQRTIYVGSVAELKAVSPSDGQSFILTELGRSGGFVFRAGDQSENVLADTNEDVWIAPGSDPTGGSGAFQWVPDIRVVPNLSPRYTRAAALDGTLSGGKTLIDGAEHVFDSGGNALRPTGDNEIILSKHGEAEIPRLAGQIAQNVETFVTDGDRLYTLNKGSYTENDSSILGVYQITDDGLVALSSGIDLGTGANCRAMTTANGYLYIFSEGEIFVYNINKYLPSLVSTVTRPNPGFVQTCSIINGLLVAPVWGGTGHIETYSLDQNGFPVLLQDYVVTAGAFNSSIVDGGDGSFFLIRHVTETDALGRFWFNPVNNRITGMEFYTIPGMDSCRYGVVRGSKLYTGSFATGDLIEIDTTPDTINSVSRSFPNMGSFILYDNYIIGGTYPGSVNSAINLDTGNSYTFNNELGWLYPQAYGDTFITFIDGDEPDEPGAAPNDSPMGQKIAVYKLKSSASLDYPKSPRVSSYMANGEDLTKHRSYGINGLQSGFTAVGELKPNGTVSYSWVELRISGFVVEDQSNTTSGRKAFEGQAILTWSGGVWTVRNPFTEYGSLGNSGLNLSVQGGQFCTFGFTAASALGNAIVRLKVEIRAQEVSGFSLD